MMGTPRKYHQSLKSNLWHKNLGCNFSVRCQDDCIPHSLRKFRLFSKSDLQSTNPKCMFSVGRQVDCTIHRLDIFHWLVRFKFKNRYLRCTKCCRYPGKSKLHKFYVNRLPSKSVHLKNRLLVHKLYLCCRHARKRDISYMFHPLLKNTFDQGNRLECNFCLRHQGESK